jgi:uncharacterized protein YcfJ
MNKDEHQTQLLFINTIVEMIISASKEPLMSYSPLISPSKKTMIAIGLGLSLIGLPLTAQANHGYENCRQNSKDKTTKGAIVGAVVGGVIGNAASNKKNKTTGTVVGAVVGGVVGAQIAKGKKCPQGYSYYDPYYAPNRNTHNNQSWDRQEDRWDRREDVYDRREDRRDSRYDGGYWDRREDRHDRREDRRDRREDRRD